MSKVTKVYNSNYKVAVQNGGTITLDTGDLTGTVVITGDLEVKGRTATIESTEVTIADNILVLSEGTQGSGLPASVGYISGIEIDRGSLPNARWLFDEQITWNLGGTSGQGTFYAITGSQKLPINTPGIVAQGTLYVNTGNGVISVTNTSNYEEKVWNYSGGEITPDGSGNVVVDDDHIPNAKALVDYVDYVFETQLFAQIEQGDTSVETIDEKHVIPAILAISSTGPTTTISTNGQHGFVVSDTVSISGIISGDQLENLNGSGITITEIVSATTFRVAVNTVGGNLANYVANSGTVTKTGFEESRVKIQVDGLNNSNFYSNRVEFEDIRIQNNEITTTTSNQPLLLSAPGSAGVKVKDVLELGPTPWSDDVSLQPLPPVDGVRIYTTITTDSSGFTGQTPGNTGIYFVNSNENRDEIISKNRSLLFSMLF